jgi:hypothetical protein
MAPKRRWRPTQRQVFVSYRRQNSSGYAGWLYDHLASVIGSRQVYIDVINIPPGTDYTERVRAALTLSSAVLVLMGPGWHEARSADGTLRLEDPDDLVRREAAWAHESGKQVIPVLVGGAALPAASDLPESLQFLSSLTPAVLSDGTWRQDVTTLVHRLRAAAAARTKKRQALIASGVLVLAAIGVAVGLLASRSGGAPVVRMVGPRIPVLAPSGFVIVNTACYKFDLPAGAVYSVADCDITAEVSPTAAHPNGLAIETFAVQRPDGKSLAYATRIYLSHRSPAYPGTQFNRARAVRVDGRAGEELTGRFSGTKGVTAVNLLLDGRGYTDNRSKVAVFNFVSGYYDGTAYDRLLSTIIASWRWEPVR